ncbi:MAG: molecular chaperone [Algicola sp.]|nr:molecular chaperone [Algicola sp.]
MYHSLRRLLLMFCCLSSPAMAYQVQPMIVELSSQGKKSLVTYRLQNPGTTALPVEVVVYRRTFDENDKEVLVPAERDFIVLPPQIEVPANGYQVFRAKYLGKPDLLQTDSYRIVFKQLPLGDEKAQSGVKMMFNFATLVFVSPKGVTAKQQSSLKCDEISDCKLTIGNQGKRVLDLSHFDYHFNKGETVFRWTTFQTITSGRFIMPGHQVVLDLAGLLKGKVTPSFEMVNLFEGDVEGK